MNEVAKSTPLFADFTSSLHQVSAFRIGLSPQFVNWFGGGVQGKRKLLRFLFTGSVWAQGVALFSGKKVALKLLFFSLPTFLVSQSERPIPRFSLLEAPLLLENRPENARLTLARAMPVRHGVPANEIIRQRLAHKKRQRRCQHLSFLQTLSANPPLP